MKTLTSRRLRLPKTKPCQERTYCVGHVKTVFIVGKITGTAIAMEAWNAPMLY